MANGANDALVAALVARRTLETPHIIAAFARVDRGHFVPPSSKSAAYEDRPLPLAVGSTISQPTTVAIMLELLQPVGGDQVLDVGAGSGWTTALLAACVGPDGFVTGTEILPELVTTGQRRLTEFGITNATIKMATDIPGSADLSFDKILVSAAVPNVPNALLAQLAVGGTMVIPVGTSLQKIRRVTNERLETEVREGFLFVPLRV